MVTGLAITAHLSGCQGSEPRHMDGGAKSKTTAHPRSTKPRHWLPGFTDLHPRHHGLQRSAFCARLDLTDTTTRTRVPPTTGSSIHNLSPLQ